MGSIELRAFHHLAIQDHLTRWELLDRLDQGRVVRVLEQLIARQQPHRPCLLESEQADSI